VVKLPSPVQYNLPTLPALGGM